MAYDEDDVSVEVGESFALARRSPYAFPMSYQPPSALERLASSDPEAGERTIRHLARVRREITAMESVGTSARILSQGHCAALIAVINREGLSAGDTIGFDFSVSNDIPGTGGFLCRPDSSTMEVHSRVWRRRGR